MRMWNVSPHLLCDKHLLGEHCEIHMFIGAVRLGRKIDGFIDNGLIETHKLVIRHEQLATELSRRGFAHRSEITEEDRIRVKELGKQGYIDANESLKELIKRCPACRKRILAEGFKNGIRI